MNAVVPPGGPLLRAELLGKRFGERRLLSFLAAGPGVRAVDGVTFDIFPGETLAIVGESGCGKSTLARLLLHLIEPSEGKVVFGGQELGALSPSALRDFRRNAQMIFQDPYGSLSPRRTVAETIAEPLQVFGLARAGKGLREQVAELMTQVGLSPNVMDRTPRQFSGGQRQRIGIARAIAARPRLIVADEPVSALDVSIQAQIVNLLQDLKAGSGFSCVFISHDLAVVRHIADRVLIMYLGRVVEIGPKREIYASPQHPYTQALLSAVPQPDPERRRQRIVLKGDIPSPSRVPSGCAFHTRCPIAQSICRSQRPELCEVAPGRMAACHFAASNPIVTG